MHTFTAHQLLSNGDLTQTAFLGELEVAEWMDWAYNDLGAGQIQIVRDDGKAVIYADNGTAYEPLRKFTMEG